VATARQRLTGRWTSRRQLGHPLWPSTPSTHNARSSVMTQAGPATTTARSGA
jgi:hypothetical protein